LYVSDYDGANETVIDSQTGAVLASVGVGANPLGVAADRGNGLVYVADSGTSNTVTVINDTTLAVVANISVGSRPVVPAYDPVKGEVFVTDSESDSVSVINDTANAVVATVGVGSWPTGIAYDSKLGEMFVVNSYSDTVSVISDTNNSVVATVPVGDNPFNPAYDPALGEMFVVDHGGAAVSVILDSNNSVVSTIPLTNGSDPVNIAYDPGTGEMLVTESNTNSVAIINTASDEVVGLVGVGSAPNGIAYAPGPNEFFAADSGSDAVSVLTDTLAQAVLTVGPAVQAPAQAESGQVLNFSGEGFGSEAALTNVSLGSTPLICVAATVGSCAGGVIGTNPIGSFRAAITIPAVAQASNDLLKIADSAGNAGNTSMWIFPGPGAAVPEATPSSIAIGQSVTFSEIASMGTGNYSYRWSGLPPGCGSSDQWAVTCTPRSVGLYLISVTVTDSNGFSATSGARAFLVEMVYPVLFVETGLPAGTDWGVIVGSQVGSSSTPNITFQEANGSFAYLVVPVNGYATSAGGFFTVNGSARTISVPFHEQTYPVVFVVLGLPAGASWSVSVVNLTNGFNQSRTSTTPSVILFLPNGTYAVTFTLPPGYTGNSTTTWITVAGRSAEASVGPLGAGSGSGAPWVTLAPYVVVAGVALLAVGLVLTVRRSPPNRGATDPPVPRPAERAGPPAVPPSTPAVPPASSGVGPEVGDPLEHVF
jgi:YVTN family beta-propeller protein